MGHHLEHDKDVEAYPYDCRTCLDLGVIYDQDAKRDRPCPSCQKGRGTY